MSSGASLFTSLKGSVVTIASDAGLQGSNVACSVYGASKGAVVSFTKSLSLKWHLTVFV